MARNIEIKARIRDRDGLMQRLATLTARRRQELQQLDTFFQLPAGRLKLREFGDGSAELIRYDREDRLEAKLSTYERVAVQDADGMRALLTRALGVRGRVQKHRTVLLVDNARVHLDEVQGLGTFLEIEVVLEESESLTEGQEQMMRLMAQLDIRPVDLIAGAYLDLLPPDPQSNNVKPSSIQNS